MRRLSKVVLLAAMMVPLAGCISLFPKSKPSQLYRFEVPAAAASTETNSAQIGVLLSPIDFQEASAADRILTMTGGEAAYVKSARWVSPAAVLFEDAVNRAFDAAPGNVRLVHRGDVAKAQFALKVEVRKFETHYDDPKAIPETAVEVHAMLSRNNDREVVGDRVFSSTVRAGDNRVGAIVPAYDQALGNVLTELTGWVNSTAGLRSAEPK
jgi:cholesterol transport system auxiliary component